MRKAKIKLGIADDHILFRKGLLSILKEADDIEVVLEAGNGQELIDMLKKGLRPQVLLLDIKMPVMDGIKAAKHIRSHYPEVKIITLTMFDEDKFITHLLELDVNGYLLKDSDPSEVQQAIRIVANDGKYFGSQAVAVMHKQLIASSQREKKRGQKLSGSETFSPRELEVLKMICREHTTSEIAEMLCLSARTIDGYRNRLMRKTKTKNSAGMVAYALENLLID
jgi:two-component system, NarL family, response regulator DegU